MCHKKEGFSIDLRAVKKWNSRHAVMGSQSVLPGIFRLAMSGRSMSRIPTMGGLRPLAGGFLRIHRREGKHIPCSMSVFLGWA